MEFRVPELGEGLYEAELVSWQVKVGDRVKRGQPLMEVMTDKATAEVPSPFAGTITSLDSEPGQIIKVGQPVLKYTPAEKGEARAEPAQAAASVPAPPATAVAARHQAEPSGNSAASRPAGSQRMLAVKAAPSVRLMARKLGVDLTSVQGTGPDGRVLIGDLSRFVRPGPAPEKTPEPVQDFGRPGSRIKLIGLRRKIAEHMVQSKKTVPHYTYVDECEVTDLVRLRESLKEDFARAGGKLTYLAFFVKAVTAALKEVPIVNASLDEEAGEIVLHDRYHIGVAVATPGGLIVPVVHDADRKNLVEIARDLERLSADARAGKSKREDLLGSTFTITSIGGVGGIISTPVINLPNAGILGLGRVVRRPVYDGHGHIRPADLIYLSLSLDHRIVDGAVGAAFANAIIRRVQKPAGLLLPEKTG